MQKSFYEHKRGRRRSWKEKGGVKGECLHFLPSGVKRQRVNRRKGVKETPAQ